MNFSTLWTKVIAKQAVGEPPEMRLEEIDFMINDVLAQMQQTPEPYHWLELSQRKQELEIMRQALLTLPQ